MNDVTKKERYIYIVRVRGERLKSDQIIVLIFPYTYNYEKVGIWSRRFDMFQFRSTISSAHRS